MYCPQCGRKIGQRDPFCRYCGETVEDIASSSSPMPAATGPEGRGDGGQPFPVNEFADRQPPSPVGIRRLHVGSGLKNVVGSAALGLIILSVLSLAIYGLISLIDSRSVRPVLLAPSPTVSSRATLLSTPTPKPTPTPAPTPEVTVYYETHSYRYYHLVDGISYEDFTQVYNFFILNLKENADIKDELSMEYRPQGKSPESGTKDIRHAITDESAITLTCYVNEEFVEVIEYTVDTEITPGDNDRYLAPIFAILDVLDYYSVLDFDETLESIDIAYILAYDEHAQTTQGKAQFEISYSDAKGLMLRISLREQ